MTTPLTPILEGYEPLTGEELVSARECAHVGYTTPLMVRRLLQTIAARDETIAGLIEERDGFKNSMVKYFHEAADSQDASLRANVGEPVTADELKKLLLPYTEKSSWSAQWIAEHICKDFGGRTIGPPMPPVNPQSPPEVETPIDMILFCPSCNLQHVDITDSTWENPPHRSHLCHSCGTIWRPADVATNGVSKIKTAGKADVVKSLPPVEPSPAIEAAREWATAVANEIVQNGCELPDRTSPDDWPEALLIEGEELHDLVMKALCDDDQLANLLLSRDAAMVERCAKELAAAREVFIKRGYDEMFCGFCEGDWETHLPENHKSNCAIHKLDAAIKALEPKP